MGIFRAFFPPPSPPTLILKKIFPVSQLIKTSGLRTSLCLHLDKSALWTYFSYFWTKTYVMGAPKQMLKMINKKTFCQLQANVCARSTG